MKWAERDSIPESWNSGMFWMGRATSHYPRALQSHSGDVEPTWPSPTPTEFPWNFHGIVRIFRRRAQPPGFPHLRDPGNALPAGSCLHGHGGAAGPPPAPLCPGNLRILGNGSGRQPGHPRDLLPQPPPGASFPGKIPLGSGIAGDFWEQPQSCL